MMKGGVEVDQVKIGNFLKKLRKEKGITQEQLAEILNVSGRTVSRWVQIMLKRNASSATAELLFHF